MEFYTAPYTLIDGRPVNGRSVQLADRSYAAYDLGVAEPGDTLKVTNEEDKVYELKKDDGDGGTLEGWQQYEYVTVGSDEKGPERLERSMGRAVRIVLLLHNSYGAPMRTSTHVVRARHHELGVVPIDGDYNKEATIISLGVVARISSCQPIFAGTVPEAASPN